MTLASGMKIGPYAILGQLGTGGQGEVYKARDTRLNRFVAIKVLPERLPQNPELKARFEREAQTLAKLSHPHICPVFDIGQQDGTDYLVMEFLEGETLARRLDKGALPLDEALGRQRCLMRGTGPSGSFIPGTLTQSSKLGKTTYRAVLQVSAGGEPLKNSCDDVARER